MRSRALLATLLVVASLAVLVGLTGSARAGADVNMYGYTSGGSFTPLENGGSMPLGATVEVHVWADLYSCDPIRVFWGDGTFSFMNFGGSFSETFTHTYSAEGTYTIYARDCANAGGNTATITVGGMGNLFDPSSDMFVPTILGFLFGFIALAMALGAARPPAARGAAGASGAASSSSWWHPERFKTFVPHSMAQHWVSYRDIPVGAPPQNPEWIPMRPGEPTDIAQTPHCTRCQGPLGWVAGGWFCMNPQCGLIQEEAGPFPRIVHGL